MLFIIVYSPSRNIPDNRDAVVPIQISKVRTNRGKDNDPQLPRYRDGQLIVVSSINFLPQVMSVF